MNNLVEYLKAISGGFSNRILQFGAHSIARQSPLLVVSEGVAWTEAIAQRLEARCRLDIDPEYRAARLDVELVNTADQESDPVRPAVFQMLLADQGLPYLGFRASGGLADGHYPPENYRTQEVAIYGSFVNCTPEGGRSSDRNIPITMVADAKGEGIWFGMEWSGAWSHVMQTPRHANATRVETGFGLSISANVSGASFRLGPGESQALPTLHFGFFDRGFENGTNHLRRYLHDRICATFEGQKVLPPLSYDHWFGIGDEYDEMFLRKQVDRAAELGLEYFAVDAAWCVGGFPHGAGNWEKVDLQKFPNGLKPLASYARSKGLKFGLWFEFERARRGTFWAQEHPEFFIDIGQDDLHLNLARLDAQDFLIERVSGLIEELDLQWSRWDYNINPAPYWKQADPSGRIQFAYMAGLYRVLDTLMQRHPHWFIETCASGGRRLDLGTMRRAHTCWFSDETVSPEICRFMQLRANRFLPGHLCNSAVVTFRDSGDANLGEADVFSRMAGALSFGGDIASWSERQTQLMRHQVELFKQVRHLLCEDFFPLLPSPVTTNDWDAGLFVSRDRKEALLLVFRIAGPESSTLQLKGLDNTDYQIWLSGYPHEKRTLTGAELMEHGLDLQLGTNQGLIYRIERR